MAPGKLLKVWVSVQPYANSKHLSVLMIYKDNGVSEPGVVLLSSELAAREKEEESPEL